MTVDELERIAKRLAVAAARCCHRPSSKDESLQALHELALSRQEYDHAIAPQVMLALIARIRELETALRRAVDLALYIESPHGTPYQSDRECYRGALGEYRAIAEKDTLLP